MQLLRISVWYNSLCFFNKFVYKIMENTPFMIYYSTLYSKSVNSVELEKNILRLGGRGGGDPV